TSVGLIGRGSSCNLPYNWDTYKQTFGSISKSLAATDHITRTLSKSMAKPAKNCGMGSGEIYVNSVGKVYPCKLVTTESWYSGDVKEQPLVEILKAEALQKARDLSVKDRRGCRTCMIRRLCGGGCRGIHMGHSGDAEVNDPQFCWVLRHQMITSLWAKEGITQALSEPESVVPQLFSTGEVWKPEIGTALPEPELAIITQHIQSLEENSLPLL
ncbi:MAG: SPASM domain-containing protein, partial [Waterburya sp.]